MLPAVVVVHAASGMRIRQPVKALPLTVMLGTVMVFMGVAPLTCVMPLSGAIVEADAMAVPTLRLIRFVLKLPYASAIFHPHHWIVPFTLFVPGPICAALDI